MTGTIVSTSARTANRWCEHVFTMATKTFHMLPRFLALGNLKAHEQYQVHGRGSEPKYSVLGLNTRPVLAKQQTHAPWLTSADAANPEAVLASTLRIDPEHSRPDESRPTRRHLFNRTLPNIGKTCIFFPSNSSDDRPISTISDV